MRELAQGGKFWNRNYWHELWSFLGGKVDSFLWTRLPMCIVISFSERIPHVDYLCSELQSRANPKDKCFY